MRSARRRPKKETSRAKRPHTGHRARPGHNLPQQQQPLQNADARRAIDPPTCCAVGAMATQASKSHHRFYLHFLPNCILCRPRVLWGARVGMIVCVWSRLVVLLTWIARARALAFGAAAACSVRAPRTPPRLVFVVPQAGSRGPWPSACRVGASHTEHEGARAVAESCTDVTVRDPSFNG